MVNGSPYRAINKRNMSQELHPGVFKPRHITGRGIFFSASIGPSFKSKSQQIVHQLLKIKSAPGFHNTAFERQNLNNI
jgi:hypothetical protein